MPVELHPFVAGRDERKVEDHAAGVTGLGLIRAVAGGSPSRRGRIGYFILFSLANLPIKENIERHKRLRADLAAEDYEGLTCSGVYTGQDGVTVKELSLLVPIPIRGTWLDILRIAKRYGQESILLDNGGLGSLVYCADNRIVNLGERRPGVAENYTSTALGEFYYA